MHLFVFLILLAFTWVSASFGENTHRIAPGSSQNQRNSVGPSETEKDGYHRGRYLSGEFQYRDKNGKWQDSIAAYRTQKSGTFLNSRGDTIEYEKGDILFKKSSEEGWFKASPETPIVSEPRPDRTNPDDVSLSSVEKEIIRLTNQERIKRGLPVLTVSPQLQVLSRQKSENMARFRNLSHGISPRPPGGENIAFNQPTAEAVVRAWMNSDGHRANILNRRYSKIGVAVSSGNRPYWTQMFQ